jgi:heat shock protein HslJ
MRLAITAALAATLLAGCGMMPKPDPPPKPFVGTKWVVQLELPIAGDQQPWFRFGDGRMEGFGGCNRIVARYVQDTVGAKAIAFGRFERGTKACDESTRAAEASMLEVLQSASSYQVTLDTMSMTGSAGTLKFKSDPPFEVPK